MFLIKFQVILSPDYRRHLVLQEAARAYLNGLDENRKATFRFHYISTDEVYGDLPHPDEYTSNVEC